MIDVKINMQASIFCNLMDIGPSPEYITLFVNEFAENGFLPSTVQEIGETGSLTRLSLKTPDNGWLIVIGSNRLDIVQNSTDSKGSNILSEEDFVKKVLIYYNKLQKHLPRKANRLALSSAFLLKKLETKELDEIYRKLNNPSKTYLENKPDEWNNRVSCIVKKEICSTEEKLNFISQISRVKGAIRESSGFQNFDRIELKFDLNTHQENINYRFDSIAVTDFFNKIGSWNNQLKEEIIDFIFKKQ